MPFGLEKKALIASGITKDDLIASYLSKLDKLHQRFIHEMNHIGDPLTTAKALFDWLWIKKPARYAPHGHYRLHHVIDSQLSRDSQAVGNCLGLTVLYNCLLRRAGIKAGALHLENAFGIGPHVLSILKTKDSIIDIENIVPDGFDYKEHINDPSRTKWGDKELVADIFNSRANDCYERDKYKKALRHYEKAIALNPHYEKARLNRAIVLDRIGIEENSSTSTRKTKN